jgi:hypothetical protein
MYHYPRQNGIPGHYVGQDYRAFRWLDRIRKILGLLLGATQLLGGQLNEELVFLPVVGLAASHEIDYLRGMKSARENKSTRPSAALSPCHSKLLELTLVS